MPHVSWSNLRSGSNKCSRHWVCANAVKLPCEYMDCVISLGGSIVVHEYWSCCIIAMTPSVRRAFWYRSRNIICEARQGATHDMFPLLTGKFAGQTAAIG